MKRLKKRIRAIFAFGNFQNLASRSGRRQSATAGPGGTSKTPRSREFYFGPQYDIHGGGVDLKFPHHEAEIAQQESASGQKPFVKIWMHTGALLVDGKKMSKSLGNFITVRDFLKKHSPEVLRWIVLNHHYRSPIDYSENSIKQAWAALDLMREFLSKLEFIEKKSAEISPQTIRDEIKSDQKDFFNDLANDVNTPLALASIFATIARYQDKVWKLTKADTEIIKNYINESLAIFGISLKLPKIPQNIDALAGEARAIQSQ